MLRAARLLPLALLLLACGKGADSSAAPAAPPPAVAGEPAPAPAPDATVPAGIGGTPGFAREGVDSANAAQQRRLDEVNQLSGQASGTPP